MKKTSIGGQALIEGLLMIGPDRAAIAVRKPDGQIIIDKRPLPRKSIISKIPIVRGAFNLFRQMVLGVKALMYSAEHADIEKEDDEKPSKAEQLLQKFFGDKFFDWMIYFTVIISLGLSVLIFILLPNWIAGLLQFPKTAWGSFASNLVEGVLRMAIFISYLAAVSRMKEIKRVWEYHGAEHKTIHCYEHEEELTVENVLKYSTKHPRCGTSFLFLVMIVSILVFALLGDHNAIIDTLLRILFIPLVAGISYELLKAAGRSNSKLVRIVNAPGMFFQMFTTREPDGSQVEVAIEAFNSALSEDKEADKW